MRVRIKNKMKTLITIPAYNEEKIVKESLKKLLDYCDENIEGEVEIVVSENGSKDGTEDIVKEMNDSRLEYFNTEPGKGKAVLESWKKKSAQVYVFMDADISTDLKSLRPLINAVVSEGYDMAIGSRFHEKSEVTRSFFRRFLSIGLNTILKIFFRTKIKDTTCGFKAINNKVKKEILPHIKNQEWFFDTELVILAEKKGLKIHEIPVDWHDDAEARESRVQPFGLVWNYLKEVIKLKSRLK